MFTGDFKMSRKQIKVFNPCMFLVHRRSRNTRFFRKRNFPLTHSMQLDTSRMVEVEKGLLKKTMDHMCMRNVRNVRFVVSAHRTMLCVRRKETGIGLIQ